YELIRELADAGLAVVLVSSEITEVIGLSDRVLVVSNGRVLTDTPASEITEHDVLGMVMEGEVARLAVARVPPKGCGSIVRRAEAGAGLRCCAGRRAATSA